MNLVKELKKIVQGEVKSDLRTLDEYSRDASLFEIKHQVVVFPKNKKDIHLMKKLQATFLLDNTSYIVTQNIVVKQYTECCRCYSCERAQRIESAAELVPQGSSR